MDFEHERVIVDACSIITLFASGHFREVLQTIPVPVMISRYVREQEAGYIFGGPLHDVRSSKEPIDLIPLVREGIIREVAVEGDDEMTTFIHLAGRMDDGEARTLAIAHHRNWAVATDDGRAIREAEKAGIQVVTTPELLKHWFEKTQPNAEQLRRALADAEARGAYRISRRHALYEWWQEHV